MTELSDLPDPLVPGRFTRSSFRPALTFEVGEGWSTGSLLDGFFDIQQRVGTPEVIAVQFAKPDAIFADDPSPVPIASAPEATDILQANPGLAGVETSESRIGGLTGRQVTVDNTSGDAAQVMRVPPGPLSILDGRRLWIALFDTPDGILAIMIGGSIAEWDAALKAAEPLLESIEVAP